MDFEPRLRTYLESLPGTPAPQVQLRNIDATELYGHLLEKLRKHEAPGNKVWIERIHREWSPERVGQFARYLERVTSPMGPRDEQGARDFAAQALDLAIDCADLEMGTVDRLELHRIGRGFGKDDVHQYALENQLIRIEPLSGARITDLGRTFLRLRGRDAVRWLLLVEVAQSTGRWDAWRTWRPLLEKALKGIDAAFEDGEPHFFYAHQTLVRLVELEVLSASADPEGEVYRYAVQDGMHALVRSVLDPGPWQTTIAALLEDESSVIVHGQGPVATDATSELTKLITHEVRNALVPVRHHIDALRAANPDSTSVERIDKARRGVVRVLKFVDELVDTTELVTEPPTSCDVADVIREAISWADGGERVQIISGAQHRVRAPRSRLARALCNVVLNALQATPSAGPVRVSHRTNNATVEIAIDDGGDGVPVEHRTKVFDEGYTTRGGPGHGFGLAFVRSLVEGRLRGKVWCEDSDLGGARFVIAIAAETKP